MLLVSNGCFDEVALMKKKTLWYSAPSSASSEIRNKRFPRQVHPTSSRNQTVTWND